jgi:alpha-tubulin suppressor-like RCC1 family protein
VRFTRRLRERRCSGVLVAMALSMAAGMAASCSSEDETPASPDVDAAVDAPGTSDASAASSDAAVDAGPRVRDAAKSDAAPLPIACASSSCATSLTTTIGDGFCALLDDGTVACWGEGNRGLLGRGTDSGDLDGPTPARVVGLSDIVALDHTCALDRSGAMFCWGLGPYLRSETEPMTVEPTPVKLPIGPATKMAVTRYLFEEGVACGLVDGGILCWGTNTDGEIAVPDPSADPTAPFPPQVIAIPDGAPIKSLVLGKAAFVLCEDGTVVSWGSSPPLGRVSSLYPDPYPRPIPLEGISSIDVASDNACAVAEGIAYCWGRRHDRKGPPLERALPEEMPMPEPVVQIATATSLNDYPERGCAVGLSGALYCWGANERGQVGDGTKNNAITPVKVVGLPGPVAQVRTTWTSTCAILTSGKVVCWGDNLHGQLGSGKLRVPSLVPQEVVLP